jgi:hypothetical protein
MDDEDIFFLSLEQRRNTNNKQLKLNYEVKREPTAT